MPLEYAVYPPLPCRASPPQGGRSARCARIALSRPKRNAGPSHESISPPVGEMPGRAEGARLFSFQLLKHRPQQRGRHPPR
ncbi:hypothetical protein CFBP6624_10805 [Agrobacterium tumefaciens]|uniref:Propionyl-coenzyme A carboxylase alpha polypeptide n=1 Tax=Agrobacterium tumefaciens TaxID=358 RepID=A0AAE6EK02_AGRTU|nr:hypothetical protein CFBP6624_10805 [Agrobacterium tumefaciens]